ncbi:T9SS type A sorting domain-containing protein [Hymenobacter metallilatus]|uniref:T9SS C-terminal target domain-containing protein n=1 Tax=Hymenobacter metallilatus TaxID=2493666 RepID=A0A428IZA2_9BACT|nr:T9SS type A sorting domain-containing protein [Hymenobacter metallilatus]RSK24345.1 T9SS C-terminal target domain-containing protein [Hymenobacter metallilatus]
MHSCLLRATLILLGLLLSLTTRAQSTWQRLYGGERHETCNRIVPVPSGGFVLAGSSESSHTNTTNLYLIRTDERGRQVWTREYSFANAEQLSVAAADVNPAGQMLLAAQTRKTDANGYTETTGILMLVNPDGRVAWQQRTQPTRTWVPPFSGIVTDATGNFWVATNEPSGSCLRLLSPTSEELRKLPLPQPGSILGLFLLPAGPLAYVVRSNAEATLVPASAAGSWGPAVSLPALAYSNSVNMEVKNVVPLTADEVLVVSGGQLDKIQLSTGAVRWSRAYSKGNLLLNATHAAQLPNGHLVVMGTRGGSHVVSLEICELAADGSYFTREITSPYSPPYLEPVVYQLGKSLSASAGGVLVHPVTGQVVVGGSLRSDAREEVFLSAGNLLGLQIGTLLPLTAWPNPVAAGESLTVPAAFAQSGQLELYSLQGNVVRRWPEPVDGEKNLSLQNIPAGLYILSGVRANGTRAYLRVVVQ